MDKFKKHWNKEIKPYIHNPADKELAEYWWRAALEWVLSNDLDEYNRPAGFLFISDGLIREELDE